MHCSLAWSILKSRFLKSKNNSLTNRFANKKKGTLIQHLKEHLLHGNMSRDDVIIYYTTVSIAYITLFAFFKKVSIELKLLLIQDRMDDVQLVDLIVSSGSYDRSL